MNVNAWLRGLGLERYRQAFEANDVDARTLRSLTQADLVEIGVASVGHRRRLLAAIATLEPEEPPGTAAALAPASLPAERRQVSVLYCELSSTAELRLQPEDMREVVQEFHDACTTVVAEYDGHTANSYGDCVLAYFGWPRAHEDDAERAARAGLALMRQIPRMRTLGEAFSARAAIATGDVVVGDLIAQGPAQEQSAVGLTPNLGARLLSLASPNQVIIDDLTRRLLPPNFALQPLGQHAFKGLNEPGPAYTVLGEQPVDNRFDARRGRDLTPMIGRDRELDLLLERWRQAQDGEGQAVLLTGEAGIGKSRLTRALLDAHVDQAQVERWQCSPYHTGSALWPVIQRLNRAAGLAAQDPTDHALDKLEATAGSAGAAALYATLLGLNGGQRYGPLQMTPQMLRERTLELLVEQLRETAQDRARMLVVEDAHWIDPTTLELLERCLGDINSTRMLILITSRPDNQPQLAAHPSVTRLSLNRLSRVSVHAIVTRLGGGGLTPQTLAAITAKTDGIPLFVEELTKAVLETGEAAIPASLHGSLMARLDRVPEVKEIAQIAACIGREFDPVLVQAVAEQPEAVSAALDTLVAAELLFRRGERSNPRYVFKHALVQEAAYQSLLRSTRQQVHGRILEALHARGGVPPEVLAHHAIGADRVGQAIELWQQAGDAALLKCAYHESAAHLCHAIELIETRTDGGEPLDRECVLHVRLGQALTGAQGYSAVATRQAYARARALLGTVTDSTLRIALYYGVWVGHSVGSEYPVSLELARAFLTAVESDSDDAGRLIAHRVVGDSHVIQGEFAQAREHLEVALDLYARSPRLDLIEQLGHEPGGAAACYLAWTLGFEGFLQQARELLAKACEFNRGVANVNARAYLHFHCALAGMFWRDQALTQHHALLLNELASEHHLRMWQAFATTFLSWVAMDRGDAAGALAGYARGLSELSAIGVKNLVPFFGSGAARALAACQRLDEARRLIEQAIVDGERTSQRWSDAELWRVRGELLLCAEHPHPAEAEHSLERALSLACARGAKLWALRAAVSLARLRMSQGRDGEAMTALAPVYDDFTEGFDTADLVEAREVLATLEQALTPTEDRRGGLA